MSPRRVDLVVLLFAVVLAGVTILDEVGPHDEGLVLAAAGRVADGELPWRDFWWNYGPGQPVLLGGLVAALGPSLLVWRIVRVLAGGVVAVLCARLVRRHGVDERWSLAAGLAAGSALAWPLTPGPGVLALVPGLAAILLAGHAERPSVRAMRGFMGTRRVVLAGGALAAVAAWLRPELGVACALGAAVACVGPGGTDGTLRAHATRAAALLAAFAGATAALYAPFVLAAPGAFADDLGGFLAIQDLQRLPFPFDPPADPNKAFEVLFPALLLTATAAWVLLGRARPLTMLPLAAAGVAYLLARTDEFHLVPLALVLAPALALGAARATRIPRTILLTALALLTLHGIERQAGRLLHPPALATVPGGVGDGVGAPENDVEALRTVIPRVRAIGRPVLVVPPRLDRVQVGNPLLNVILDLPNPTRHDVIQPGVVTKDAAQRAMIEDLRRTGATVIRWSAPAAILQEPNGAGRERGSTRFDRFVRDAYEQAFAAGDYRVLVPTSG